jgi:hypothetical protein
VRIFFNLQNLQPRRPRRGRDLISLKRQATPSPRRVRSFSAENFDVEGPIFPRFLNRNWLEIDTKPDTMFEKVAQQNSSRERQRQRQRHRQRQVFEAADRSVSLPLHIYI